MTEKNLKNKPLVEVMIEIKWALTENEEGHKIDPHHKLLLSRFFDKISGVEGEYPVHEELTTANWPDEVTGHVVQHRFYVDKGKAPVVQLGPGVVTLNETTSYTWDEFKNRSISLYNRLMESYPKPDELRVESISLQYINVIEFDFSQNNILDFIKDKLKLEISMPSMLFDGNIEEKPTHLNSSFVFTSSNPQGDLGIKFATAMSKNEDKLLKWDLKFISEFEESQINFDEWLAGAHDVLETCFFKLINGDLERRFRDG